MIKLNNRFFVLVAVCPFLLSFTACCKKPDLEKERLTLLELHKEQEVAHLNKDANLFVDQFADKMVSVKGGAWKQPDKFWLSEPEGFNKGRF